MGGFCWLLEFLRGPGQNDFDRVGFETVGPVCNAKRPHPVSGHGGMLEV